MFKIPFCSQTMFAASTRLSIARLMKANKYVLKNHLDACAFFIRSFRLLALLISIIIGLHGATLTINLIIDASQNLLWISIYCL